MFASDSLRIGQYAPYGAMAPHSHDRDSLGVILDGDFVEQIGGSERCYKTGCVTFGPAGITHAQRFGADGARQIIVTPGSDWLSYLASKGVRLADAPFVQGPQFLHLGIKLLNEIQRDDDFTSLARESILLEIIAAFGRADIANPPGRPPVWLAAARDYLHDHVTAPLSMKQIARVVGRHEIHLAREFKRYFGLSVGSYLRQKRTERAADLIRTTRANITDIALRCGFANHAHLCRTFKAHFGMSPSQYRAQY
jgi:AraC family transcriptional regulator